MKKKLTALLVMMLSIAVLMYACGGKPGDKPEENTNGEETPVNTKLDAPKNLVASDGTIVEKIEVSWGAVNGADEYVLYKSDTEAGTYTLLKAVNSTKMEIDDATGDTIWFKVKAQKTGGVDQSEFSNADSGYAKKQEQVSTPAEFTLKGEWKSTNEQDRFKASTRILSGDFDNIMVMLKDQSTVRTRSSEINPSLSKMGDVDYNPNNPLPELITISPNRTRSNMTEQDWIDMLDYYNALPEVEYACPNLKGEAFATNPNDEYYQHQWDMQQLNMPEAWEITDGNESIIVAVIDSGFAYDLPDKPLHYMRGWDFADNDDDVYPRTNVLNMNPDHGTHVAGTIAQNTNNNIGVAGMAKNVTILPIKVFPDGNPQYATEDVIQAIDYAIQEGAKVINMSLGISSTQMNQYVINAYQTACDKAFNAGIAVIVATGNSAAQDDTKVAYPAACNNVMAVGATNSLKRRSPYSQYGTGDGDPNNHGIDIMAPGGDLSLGQMEGIIQETVYKQNGQYGYQYLMMQGTSMASPHVAGLAGLMLSINPNLTPQQIYDIIEETADRDMADYNETEYGKGLINPVKALTHVKNDLENGGDTGGNTGDDPVVTTEYSITDELTHSINAIGDSAVWEINAIESRGISIRVTCQSSNGFDLKLYDPDGTKVEESSTSYNIGSLTFTTAKSGTHKIEITRTK